MTYPTNPMAALYDRIGNAEVSQGGTYLSPGGYLLRVRSAFFKQNRQGKTMFIAEFDILESTAPDRPAGSQASWVANLTDHDSAPGNIRAFIAACLGIRPSDTARLTAEVTPAVISGCTDPARNALAGVSVRCAVSMQMTRRNTQFSRHDFEPATGAAPALPAPAAPALPAPAAPALPATPPGWTGPLTAPALAPAPAPALPRAPIPAPPPPPPPVLTAAFPPVGWTAHPTAPGYYYRGQEVLTEEELRGR